MVATWGFGRGGRGASFNTNDVLLKAREGRIQVKHGGRIMSNTDMAQGRRRKEQPDKRVHSAMRRRGWEEGVVLAREKKKK